LSTLAPGVWNTLSFGHLQGEATGDYSYRGEDPDTYEEVFDLEAGVDNGDLEPLIEFLDFINNLDDDAFDTELAEPFDVDAFATYLAVEGLIANADDIEGRCNNSCLFYDTETEMVASFRGITTSPSEPRPRWRLP
jgi:spore coat protein CotH